MIQRMHENGFSRRILQNILLEHFITSVSRQGLLENVMQEVNHSILLQLN